MFQQIAVLNSAGYDMDFGLLPPEVNSGLMYTGPGAGPMLAAAASWDAIAAQLESAASGCSAASSGLANCWLGPSSTRMAAAATRQVAWLRLSATHAEKAAAQAYSAAAAYETAFGMTVPPSVIAANRVQLMALIATNFFGQNTPAIAATEAQYMQMWVQDATAMYSYAMAAESASTLEPFDEPQQTTKPTGQEDQAAAVARATADSTTAHTQSAVQQVSVTAGSQVVAGDTVNVSPGGAIIDPGVTVTASAGYPVTFTKGATFQAITALTGFYANGQTFTTTPGAGVAGFAFDGTITSGTFLVLDPLGPPLPTTGAFTVPGAGIVAGGGVTATFDASGLVTAVNTGTIVTGPAVVTPVAPVASGASGATAAAPLAAAPGLAGTSGIQPQLNVEGLTEWARGLSVSVAAPD